MNVTVIGTLKKYRNEKNEWYSLLIRQYDKDYFINVYWKEGTEIPNSNHKVHLKARGKLFKDRRTFITRLSFYDAEILEDLGIDEIEVLAERKQEEALNNDTFSLVDSNSESDELPWG